MTSERAVHRTRPYGGEHNPQPDGMCEHRWANRVRRTVHCGYAEGYATALAIVDCLAAARGEPPEPAIDGDTLRAVLEAMWPHHTEGIGSSPPSPSDHTYEVWDPFLPGSPDSVATALAAALRDKP